jgi:hypothetical protein
MFPKRVQFALNFKNLAAAASASYLARRPAYNDGGARGVLVHEGNALEQFFAHAVERRKHSRSARFDPAARHTRYGRTRTGRTEKGGASAVGF